MVKVKAEASAGQVAPLGKVSGKKKKKSQKTVLKVVSNRNGTAQPAVSLKTKKKNRKRRNKGKKGTLNETHSETSTKEMVPQDSVSESKEQQIFEKDKKASSSDTALDELKDDKPESGVNEANTQSKKKRKKKNKRKASEALEGTDGTSEATEDKDAGEGVIAREEKPSKRQKVEKQEDEGSTADKDDELKKSKKKKVTRYVLFIGNLPFEATEEDVREHFKVVGDNIVRVTLMSREKDKGKGKGYGFLELANATAYTAAIKLNMSQFKDRKINVEYTTGGKKSKKRTSLIKLKTRKLLGQKGKKGKKKGGRKH